MTTVVMWDTRPPAPGTYWSLAAALNRRYADDHGYEFVWFSLETPSTLDGTSSNAEGKTVPSCYLRGTTGRGAPWCKLLAIHRAFSYSTTVIFVDSDAWLRNMTRIVDEFHASRHCVWFPSDRPWGYANSAMHIWRVSPTCRRHLRDWWLRNVSCCTHKYEQSALVRSNLTRAFPFDWMRPTDSWRHAVHLPSLHHHLRLPMMIAETTSFPEALPLPPTTWLDVQREATALEDAV